MTATLEYVEEKTNVGSVFVNFQNDRNDRGGDLLSSWVLDAEAAISGFPFRRPTSPHSFKRAPSSISGFHPPRPRKEVKISSILFRLHLAYREVPAGGFQEAD